MEILDEAGSRYTFGLPVFERNTLSLSFDVDANPSDIVQHSVIFCETSTVSEILTGATGTIKQGLEGSRKGHIGETGWQELMASHGHQVFRPHRHSG